MGSGFAQAERMCVMNDVVMILCLEKWFVTQQVKVVDYNSLTIYFGCE